MHGHQYEKKRAEAGVEALGGSASTSSDASQKNQEEKRRNQEREIHY